MTNSFIAGDHYRYFSFTNKKRDSLQIRIKSNGANYRFFNPLTDHEVDEMSQISCISPYGEANVQKNTVDLSRRNRNKRGIMQEKDSRLFFKGR